MSTNVHRELPKQLSLSEFLAGSNASCGPDAELEALNELAAGNILDANHLAAIQKRDAVLGWFSPTGGEPLSSIYNDINKYENVHLIQYIPYSNTPNADAIHTALINYAGTYPIVVEVGNASALPSNESGVHYHFVTITGIDSVQGYEFLNGDDIQALKGFATYPARWMGWNVLLAAQPVGIIVFGRNTMSIVPAGWHDDGTTLTAPNSKTVVHGFRDFVLAWPGGWEADNIPLDNEDDNANPVELGNTNLGNGSRQCFRYRVLAWTPQRNVYVMWVGQELLATYAEIANLKDNPVTVKPDVSGIVSELEDVTNKLKAL